ncbi:conjugal transfer protein TraR [Candidatus Falkowbacteria bacterium CG10_big_fil_rev_8_21_14_0_10_43_11]|uniref:Conjugal transfer protein TraR n=1 Tax=Candidatus Falkowbacteria bacterium CG10_big_fil_rev_8_21_14_0_10_43_11 TaxID=1974568 RepID=A0A2M6WMJ2_9BACT|nr:MAG: conjugal transfer protein TraR [Candidatus Falkowbacteria bacterium CG10_big_fil_rev_8_21_14_0_10_43_11]
MFTQEFIQKMKERLLSEKQSVEEKLKELHSPEAPVDNPDEDDLANDAAEDIIEESSRAAYREILEKIDAALARVERGTYGICLKTGKEIPHEHLEQEPWAEERPPIPREL